MDKLLHVDRLLQQEDIDQFRGKVVAVKAYAGSDLAYGGHLVAQSTAAAYATVDGEMSLNSVHSYFVRYASADQPVIYNVRRLRDGRSFSIRLVTARQGEKNIVLVQECSFQRGVVMERLTLSPVFPDHVPSPDRLPTVVEARKLSPQLAFHILDPSAFAPSIECRISATGFNLPPSTKHQYFIWLRNVEPSASFDRVQAHCMAVFLSDISVLGLAMAVFPGEPRFQANLSLDHCLWIHEHQFRMDDWILYEMEAVSGAGPDRVLVFGRMWTRDGRLLLSMAQEGLARVAKL